MSVCDKKFSGLCTTSPMRSEEEDAELQPIKGKVIHTTKHLSLSARLVGLKVRRPWEVVALTIQAHSLSAPSSV